MSANGTCIITNFKYFIPFQKNLIHYLCKIVLMEKRASKSSVFGRFTNVKKDVELIFSYKDSTLTIVERSINKIPQSVSVCRAKVSQITQTLSKGECIEKSSFSSSSSNYVYKFVQINSGRRDNGLRSTDENNITVDEYRLENPHKQLSCSEKLIGYTVYEFVLLKQKEKVEVSKFIMKVNGVRSLLSHSLFSKQDNSNRNWQDVPVNDEILSAVKTETWNLRYLITKKCCWEDCELTTEVKCSRCHHYVCQKHVDERIEIEEDEESNADVEEFMGDIVINSFCWHCENKPCVFECLRWF